MPRGWGTYVRVPCDTFKWPLSRAKTAISHLGSFLGEKEKNQGGEKNYVTRFVAAAAAVADEQLFGTYEYKYEAASQL